MRGSIQRRGDAWRLVIDAGPDPITGRRRQTSRTVRGTKRDAQVALTQMLAEASQGVSRGQDSTLGELLDAWLAQAKLSPSTALDYRRAIASHLPGELLGRLLG